MSSSKSRLLALADSINSTSASKLHSPSSYQNGFITNGYVSSQGRGGAEKRKALEYEEDDDDDVMIMDGPHAPPPPPKRKVSSRKLADSAYGNGTERDDDVQMLEDGDEYGQNHAGPSTLALGSIVVGGKPVFQLKQDLKQKLASLDTEIKSVLDQMKPLQTLHSQLSSERNAIASQLSSLNTESVQIIKSRKTKSPSKGGIDYMSHEDGEFEWTIMMKKKMRDVWGIREFRLCQEGVCNANMDGRDILCVMPTGGGKSLTYQLPALLSPGTTIVISPLLSLIADQVMHLREAGVECVMLTGATSKADQNEAFGRMANGPSGREKEIKLCYVTPEKVAKSKRFVSVLESLSSAGRLARIVIDEAHCCSQLGHDFRPDYKKLSVLKTLFPNVPILAVTATLSRKVLPDLLKILRLPQITDGRAANDSGTVYFTAPLYRKNLHYSVVPKPSNAKAAIEVMAKYITTKHLNKCGIVYCLSKKDTETVAEALRTASNGAIKTGVYHADVPDGDKQEIHRKWRSGKIHCVCATIAFGLGIDCPMTEYVLHHSLSKSMDGYYQETGRAGRDGRDADCVLFYRGQDATRLSSLTLGEVGGQEKVYEMLRYAQDVRTCRKIAFAKYFSTSASLPTNAWDDDTGKSSSSHGVQPCGHCDNCLRDPATYETVDVTVDVWSILRVCAAVCEQGGRVTVSGLAELARGLAGGSFPVVGMSGKEKGKIASEKGSVNVVELSGGKVSLSKEQTEYLLIELVLQDYLREDFHPNSYSVNVYMQPGSKAFRLSRLTREQVDAGELPVAVETTFLKKPKRATKAMGSTKRKRTSAAELDNTDEDEEDADLIEDGQSELSSLEEIAVPPKKATTSAKASATRPSKNLLTDDEPIDIPSDDEPDLPWLPSGNGWEETIPYGRK